MRSMVTIIEIPKEKQTWKGWYNIEAACLNENEKLWERKAENRLSENDQQIISLFNFSHLLSKDLNN